jgi:hypothetical protein
VTANEGDAKDAPGIPNEDRVVNLFDAGNAPPNVTADVASVLQLGRCATQARAMPEQAACKSVLPVVASGSCLAAAE